MADAATLRGLLERVEKAKWPEANIDWDLWETFDPLGECPAFGRPVTHSLDAALALVERALPGWRPIRTYGPTKEGIHSAKVAHGPTTKGATPALALLAAMLRVLLAQSETGGLRA